MKLIVGFATKFPKHKNLFKRRYLSLHVYFVPKINEFIIETLNFG